MVREVWADCAGGPAEDPVWAGNEDEPSDRAQIATTLKPISGDRMFMAATNLPTIRLGFKRQNAAEGGAAECRAAHRKITVPPFRVAVHRAQSAQNPGHQHHPL